MSETTPVEQGRTARMRGVDRSNNPYPRQPGHSRREWYEGWDEQNKVSPASSTTSTWSTNNYPGG